MFDVGAYVEAREDAMITNSNRDRTHPCIYLGPSGNLQGSHLCFDLNTGAVVVRRSAEQIPYPERILKMANAWGKKREKSNHESQIRVSKPNWREI